MVLNKIPLSFNHVFLLLIFHLANWCQVKSQSYRIHFVTLFSPPTVIPQDPNKLYYSVPLKQLISRPIVVQLQDVQSKVVIPTGNPDVIVSSIDASQNKDSWKTSGGKLCQQTLFGKMWPERLNRGKYKMICGSNEGSTVLVKKFVKDKIILDWISHQHPKGIVPTNSRFLRVNIPAMKLSADSNPFNVTVPAAKLVIAKQPPKTVIANTGFDVSAEIHDDQGNVVTEGLDSMLYVELAVPYEYKQFYHAAGKDMLIYNTEIRLSGKDVAAHQATNDLVIRKKAYKGKVTFKDVRILDVARGLKLNLTMYMSRDPWLRAPPCFTCYADVNAKDVNEYGLVRFRPMKPDLLRKIPAVNFTSEFDVGGQKLVKLHLRSIFNNHKLLKITRNFPIPGPMYVEATDKNDNRIYSGPDSSLPIQIETIPPNICISDDHSKYIREGYGEIKCSICQIVPSVQLVIYSNADTSIVVNSTSFNVVGDVHIGHFDHFRYSGAGTHIEPHVNSFVRFSAEDINTGHIPGVLKHFQMRIMVETVETENSVTKAINMYGEFRRRAESEPSKSMRAVIMPNDINTAAAMIRDVNNDKVTMLSVSQKQLDFTEEFFFNRFCWNWDQITKFFMYACKERGWTRLSLLIMMGDHHPEAFLKFASQLNITINEEVAIPLFNPKKWKEGFLSDQMNEIKSYETSTVLCFVNTPYQLVVLSEAYRAGLSSGAGYQWLFLSDHARVFPIESDCGPNVKCSEAFKGSLLFTESYNNSNFNTLHWHRILDYFLAGDRASLLGLEAKYPEGDTGSMMGLGYDAIWLYAEALSRIISRQLTASGLLITQELRKISLAGLTGLVKLSGEGERTGFLGKIEVVNSEINKIQPLRYVVLTNLGVQVELNYLQTPTYNDFVSNTSLSKVPLPTSEIYNLREYSSFSGGINEANNMLSKDKAEPWPSVEIRRYEKVMPQFMCKHSCGKRVSITDINLYDRGICTSMDKCACYFGYYGKNCEQITCSCLFGQCALPFQCTCDDGWSGKKCDAPICENTCQNGKCVKPNTCKCFSSLWVGAQCQNHIAVIITPVVLLVVALIYLLYRGSFWLKKYLARKAALSDLSWLVRWTDVSKNSNATSKVSCMMEDLHSWNKEKWHVKFFNSKTIDVDDFRVRYDMVELMGISHQNLITYGGACLTYPNVCILVEPTQKGSLEDILVNDTIQLGWDFRFSFMKDICKGMNYLHTKTELHSHGRLKSSNCLLDNRWTIRLSGFGASTIRYGPYSIQQMDGESEDVYYQNQTSLLWTAPELLQSVSCLDDVRTGTQEGDSYSFGIIVSEIVTRDVPFGHERTFLSLFSILDLIVDKDNPNLDSEREVWSSIGGDLFLIRPQVTSEQLPESKAVKKRFKKMMDELWCEEPQLRLSFQKLINLLDKIHPSKGELMDNLIMLLESYSSNLEKVVVERTADLEVEKTKIDNIISQMLPRQVVESLKNGEKVQPEIFDNVTVFYSDIVGFTTIAKKSKPMQVVDLLNTLYGKFDSVLAQYDVYKVETIGDAYVVSSGVPEHNGNAHAGEIATASIDIVCTIMTVPIPHLPDDKLLLRIGIHSGSVVAGVVGLKMPRYTLFGETMQITANMEATSKPLHIQVSHYAIDILAELGGYSYTRRGEKEVCGRQITTYWLTGKDGYEKILPQIVPDE